MPSRRPARYELYIMVLLVLFWGCIGLNRVGIGFIFPIIVPEFHMQLWQAGLLISGTSISWALSSWIGGWLSDNRGRRAILLPAVAFTALATAAMGATWNFLSMFVVRDLLGLGDGIGWSVGQATISEEAAPQRRGFEPGAVQRGLQLLRRRPGRADRHHVDGASGLALGVPDHRPGHRGRVRRAVRRDAGADDARRRAARSTGARRSGCCVSARCCWSR